MNTTPAIEDRAEATRPTMSEEAGQKLAVDFLSVVAFEIPMRGASITGRENREEKPSVPQLGNLLLISRLSATETISVSKALIST